MKAPSALSRDEFKLAAEGFVRQSQRGTAGELDLRSPINSGWRWKQHSVCTIRSKTVFIGSLIDQDRLVVRAPGLLASISADDVGPGG